MDNKYNDTPSPHNPLVDRLAAVQARITAACAAAGRDPGSVSLLAVSKTHPDGAIRALAAAGQRAFGESYLQEAVDKIEALAGFGLTWHFIGRIQSNKTVQIAARFDWVQAVDRLEIAERLSRARGRERAPLQVCLQVNAWAEASKAGCAPRDLPSLAAAVAGLPGLALRGLMGIPPPAQDRARQRDLLRPLRGLFEDLRGRGLALDTLSMGMSADLEAAIAEGATMVRVGTDLFGPRAPVR